MENKIKIREAMRDYARMLRENATDPDDAIAAAEAEKEQAEIVEDMRRKHARAERRAAA
jgi:hypothetical protein